MGSHPPSWSSSICQFRAISGTIHGISMSSSYICSLEIFHGHRYCFQDVLDLIGFHQLLPDLRTFGSLALTCTTKAQAQKLLSDMEVRIGASRNVQERTGPSAHRPLARRPQVGASNAPVFYGPAKIGRGHNIVKE